MPILQNADNQGRILVLLHVSVPEFRNAVFEVVSVAQIPVSAILMDHVEDQADDAKYDEATNSQGDFEEESHACFELGGRLAGIGNPTKEKTCAACPMLDGEEKRMIYLHCDRLWRFAYAGGDCRQGRCRSGLSPFFIEL